MALLLTELTADTSWFPAPETALTQPDGLLAIGGDLSTARLFSAYQQGIFPWFSKGDPLLWWSPAIRATFAPDSLKLNRSLRKYQLKQRYSFSCNLAFNTVIRHCAAPRLQQKDTWILPKMQLAYQMLHQAGQAHSIEVWREQQLVGGLYGVAVGQLFCGESMFNLEPNTAKLALVMLQQHLQTFCAGWIDCQIPNPFLLQNGAQPMPRQKYLQLLNQLRPMSNPKSVWQPQRLQLVLHD